MKRFYVQNTIPFCFSYPNSGHHARNILILIMMLHHFQRFFRKKGTSCTSQNWAQKSSLLMDFSSSSSSSSSSVEYYGSDRLSCKMCPSFANGRAIMFQFYGMMLLFVTLWSLISVRNVLVCWFLITQWVIAVSDMTRYQTACNNEAGSCSLALANDQLDAQIFIYLLQSSTCTCFEQYLAHPEAVKLG